MSTIFSGSSHLCRTARTISAELQGLLELGFPDNQFYGGIPKWIGERLSSLSILSWGGLDITIYQDKSLHVLAIYLSRLSYLVPYSPEDPGSHPAYWNEVEFNVKGEIREFTLTLDP